MCPFVARTKNSAISVVIVLSDMKYVAVYIWSLLS